MSRTTGCPGAMASQRCGASLSGQNGSERLELTERDNNMARIKNVPISLAWLMSSLIVQQSAVAADQQSPVSGTVTKSSLSAVNTVASGDVTSSTGEIRRLFDLYKDARSSHMLEEADTLAKRIVDVSIRANGIDSKVTATALTNLAILQMSNEDNISAVRNFSAAIDIVERLDSRLSSDLIIPLKGMGTAYLQAGDSDRARDAWNRAVHISHVNFGPHNFEQIETLYSIGRLFYKAGMRNEVTRVQKRISYLQKRDAMSGSIGK